MEAGEYGLTRGTCFVARRLEVIAVPGLLCMLRCVLGGAFFFVFFSSNAHGLLQVRGILASCTSLLVMRPFFAFRQKSLFIPGCVQGAII